MTGEIQQRFWIKHPDPDHQWSIVVDRGRHVSTVGLHYGGKLYPTHVFEFPTKKLIQYLTDGTFKSNA
jgi:hypothetical protein